MCYTALMGFCHESHGANRISVEERTESFYIHPGYGYDPEGVNHDDSITLNGERTSERASFARHWREDGHPEFLLEDVPDLLRALADLSTCPESVKEAIRNASS